jgi:uncharacterized protein (TIGR00255 family)
MKSMTGYGRSQIENGSSVISVEIRSVNNRYLEIVFKLPPELQPFEAKFKRQIADRLSRGRIDVNIQICSFDQSAYELNKPLISSYLNALREIKTEFEVEGQPDINAIIRLPNILIQKKGLSDSETTETVEKAIASALDMLEKMRQLEGESLKAELIKIIQKIESEVPFIEDEQIRAIDTTAERLERRVNELMDRIGRLQALDQGRLAQEIAFLADRTDISEEIARLKSHIAHFKSLLDETEPVGKRLDFLTQELNREANTISSKTQSILIKESALRLKNEIEKIREQVQNIE